MYFANIFLISLSLSKKPCAFSFHATKRQWGTGAWVLCNHRGIYFPSKSQSGLSFPGPSVPCSQRRPSCVPDEV
jgi:hypothetical protein